MSLSADEMVEYERLREAVQKPTVYDTVARHASTITRLRQAMTTASAILQTKYECEAAMREARIILDHALEDL